MSETYPEAWQHALDDLWGCIGKPEMEQLQPETVRLAKENHRRLWHTDSADELQGQARAQRAGRGRVVPVTKGSEPVFRP